MKKIVCFINFYEKNILKCCKTQTFNLYLNAKTFRLISCYFISGYSTTKHVETKNIYYFEHRYNYCFICLNMSEF